MLMDDGQASMFLMPKIKLPSMGTTVVMNRHQQLQQQQQQQQVTHKVLQPELQLDNLQIKKKKFVFNTDQLFAKPLSAADRDLVHEDSELSLILDNAKTDEELSSVSRSSKSGRYHKEHQHNGRHQDRSHRSNKQKGGKITISDDRVI